MEAQEECGIDWWFFLVLYFGVCRGSTSGFLFWTRYVVRTRGSKPFPKSFQANPKKPNATLSLLLMARGHRDWETRGNVRFRIWRCKATNIGGVDQTNIWVLCSPIWLYIRVVISVVGHDEPGTSLRRRRLQHGRKEREGQLPINSTKHKCKGTYKVGIHIISVHWALNFLQFRKRQIRLSTPRSEKIYRLARDAKRKRRNWRIG